jgi:predicted AlkP superfamily phosphohydrolase/phosphomutase
VTGKLFVLGLDCLGPEVLGADSLLELPHLRRLVEGGLSGPLESVLPPITIPAWTSMTSGRDPGELGIYGFRNRLRYDYGELGYASSRWVRSPRLWDHVGQAGGRSIVVGVPQTSPPPAVAGELVSGFEAAAYPAPHTHPPELEAELADFLGDYRFDAQEVRIRPRAEILAEVFAMTERRFQLMAHLMSTRLWNFAMLCEIGPDRLHHCFWSDHDPRHPRHDPGSPFRGAIRGYYRFLDQWLGRLLEIAGSGSTVLVASDHGAQPMHGGVCINEVLRQAGWLVLREEPSQPMPLDASQVDWGRTRAWAAGGYYARIFLNLAGREPRGTIPLGDRDQARQALTDLLSLLDLPARTSLRNEVLWPEKVYRRVRGLAPDLLVLFGDLKWRSLGSIGWGRTWLEGNDVGVDEANHARQGLYVLAGPQVPRRAVKSASILDVAPTLLRQMGLPVPQDLGGADLLEAVE